jgi:hypothetical protein
MGLFADPSRDPENAAFIDPLTGRPADLCLSCNLPEAVGDGDPALLNMMQCHTTSENIKSCSCWWHLRCINFTPDAIPDGDWICRACSNTQLDALGLPANTDVGIHGTEIPYDEEEEEEDTDDPTFEATEAELQEEILQTELLNKDYRKEWLASQGLPADDNGATGAAAAFSAAQEEEDILDEEEMSEEMSEEDEDDFDYEDVPVEIRERQALAWEKCVSKSKGTTSQSDENLDSKPKAKPTANETTKGTANIVHTLAARSLRKRNHSEVDGDGNPSPPRKSSRKASKSVVYTDMDDELEEKDEFVDDSEEEDETSVGASTPTGKKAPAKKKATTKKTARKANALRPAGAPAESDRQQQCTKVRTRVKSAGKGIFQTLCAMSNPLSRSDKFDKKDPTHRRMAEYEKDFPWNVHTLACYTEQGPNVKNSTSACLLQEPEFRFLAGSKVQAAKLQEKFSVIEEEMGDKMPFKVRIFSTVDDYSHTFRDPTNPDDDNEEQDKPKKKQSAKKARSKAAKKANKKKAGTKK